MAKKENKGAKLTTDDRLVIAACLHKGEPAKKIAERLGFSVSTVYRELERGSVIKNKGAVKCPSLGKFGVCNACCKKAYCGMEKRFYDFDAADRAARSLRSESRSGTILSDEEIAELDKLSEQIRDTGSIHHVFASNPWVAGICCERTLRRAVYAGELSVKCHELRRFVRFKREYDYSAPKRIVVRDVTHLLDRTYRDFLDFIEGNKKALVSQYDSVVGRIADRNAILTITFPRFNLQIGRLVKKGDAKSAKAAIIKVMDSLAEAGFKDALAACICDNGTEFATFYEIEDSARVRGMGCRAFYARPYRSNDKSECERNHEFVRYALPKGKSLDGLTQEQVDAVFDNINSFVRPSKGDRTPYECAERALGKAFLDALGVKKIDKRKVRLVPII